jgi:cytochrome c-type biogenesis protein CcmH
MVLFAFIAGLLVGAAASRLALPLWRSAATLARRRTSSEGGSYVHAAFVRAPYVRAGVLVASFAVVAGLLYLAIGSRHAPERPGKGAAAPAGASPAGASTAAPPTGTAGAAKSMDAAVAGLEARLARDGGTPADWTLLAQAYEFLGRPEDAKRARAKAGTPAAGPAVWQMGASALTAAAAAAADTGTTPGSPAPGRSGNTSPPAVPAAPAAVPAQPVVSAADLERRVAANPRDVQSWLALADLRRGQRDWAGARAAYLKLVDLRAMSAPSWADYADVLGSLASGSLGGEASRAIDSALALDGTNPKALWLKASQANEEHRYSEALVWWKKLRAVLPPDSADARMVDSNITEATSLATPGAVPVGTQAAVPATPTTVAAGPGASAEVTGTVSLETRFADRVQPGATLFIYAKAADSPGPPLAVLRTTVGTWPVSFRLDDSMAMMPTRRLSQFDRVVIEARISRSGQATPATGDLYVTSQVLRPAAGTRLALVINREIG